jgi:hypothetical protein
MKKIWKEPQLRITSTTSSLVSVHVKYVTSLAKDYSCASMIYNRKKSLCWPHMISSKQKTSVDHNHIKSRYDFQKVENVLNKMQVLYKSEIH